ncbi:hypothetical protein ACFFUT_05310 [Pseudohalocynthiibacter aestuariivivens]|uniref:Uncharacterized protein n=1 Tax=Pseudohalocynthiibacter aestuariivivens TaxID=1591409 RepID=A0ABV5JCL9_9RHOB|nr:hypothetical protein [Pseudohalocynthiibacter aestuariivivens]MBS9717309.1 hypothetical protein [Pseudohalocynthiibacter aestuariivivens]
MVATKLKKSIHAARKTIFAALVNQLHKRKEMIPFKSDLVSAKGFLEVVKVCKLAWLKPKGDKTLGDVRVWGGEMVFILLLLAVAVTGLMLYAVGGSVLMPALLTLHLGAILAFFLLMPFSKMVHGFYRLTSLVRDAQLK